MGIWGQQGGPLLHTVGLEFPIEVEQSHNIIGDHSYFGLRTVTLPRLAVSSFPEEWEKSGEKSIRYLQPASATLRTNAAI